MWCITTASALTFELMDGTKVEGDVISAKPDGLQIRTGGNNYEKLEWGKFSQSTLNELKKDRKLEPYVEPYIEIPLDEKIKKTEVTIKEVPRLERPAKGSLLGAMFSSSIGIVCMLLLYGANIYAGYEVAVVRAYPVAMVCGIAAVVPVIGPVIFLCLPTKMPAVEDALEGDEQDVPAETYSVGRGASNAESAAHAAASPTKEKTQSFKRGQFTFNKRFIETKFAGFFGAVRNAGELDLSLIIKTAHSEFITIRIAEISTTDMQVDVYTGGTSQQVNIPFAEILEMKIKHKDA